MHSWYRLSFLTALLTSVSFSQSHDRPLLITPPKREFRGAWIATVSNIDWPLNASDPVSKQQTDLLATLDALKAAGINAVFFQVRSSCDAFYRSSIEPWSQWLTGTQGVDPGWDPLEFIIAACRERGMELHAWFNPYRAVNNVTTANIAPNHITNLKPYLIRDYQTQTASGTVPIKVLDPGHPETVPYILSVIMDVVRRYDIDGVHFDDYFYPYPITGVQFPDLQTYNENNPTGLSLSDWRRENVNRLIRTVRESLLVVKPRLKFGVSPFGIWRNRSSDVNGSLTNGAQSFDDIYADSRRWLREKWVDYLAPQIYWNIGFNIADYGVLVPWWNTAFANERHLYIGQATYRIHPANTNWPVQEIINQVNFNRDYLSVRGSIHFSAKYFRDNTKRLRDSLQYTVYSSPALLPSMPWAGKDVLPPNRPTDLIVMRFSSFFVLNWSEPAAAPDGDRPLQYVIYRSTSFPANIDDPRNIIQIGAARSYVATYPATGNHVYTVTALDRNHNESERSSTVIVSSTGDVIVGVQERVTVPTGLELQQNYPNPFNSSTVIQFTLPFETHTTLKVYDFLGREVAVLVDRILGAGGHQVSFEAGSLTSGLYIYRLVAGGRVMAKKMQLVK